MSPTVLRIGPYRLFFFSNEGEEPPHIHVERDRKLAKFWLDPVRLVRDSGFASHELTRIEARVRDNESLLLESWREFFDR